MIVLGTNERGITTTNSSSGMDWIVGERSRAVSAQAQVVHDESRSRTGSLSVDLSQQLTPPPGKIVQTEEVMVEYEERRHSRQWEGQGQEHDQWPSIGTAV